MLSISNLKKDANWLLGLITSLLLVASQMKPEIKHILNDAPFEIAPVVYSSLKWSFEILSFASAFLTVFYKSIPETEGSEPNILNPPLNPQI